MNTSELYDAFRSDVVDVAKPYLWSDDEVFRYMDAAYKMFVRLTGGIKDFTSEATVIPIITGERVADSHPSILRIFEAQLESDNTPINIVNITDTNAMAPSDYGRVRELLSDRSEGAVHSMVIGRQKYKVEFVSTPVADDNVLLSVSRLPLDTLTASDQELCEVEDHHHIYLLEWMKHLAYRKQDADTFDKTKSDECEVAFKKYCALSKEEFDRMGHKTRIVQYGGY